MKRNKIYLSYSSLDNKFAQILTQQLENNGLSVFRENESFTYDEKSWHLQSDSIETCSIFIALITENFIKSSWCQKETILASRYHLHIIPCRLNDSRIPDWLPLTIGNIDIVQLNMNESQDKSLDKLVSRIKDINKSDPNDNIKEAIEKVPFTHKLCKLKFVNDNNSEIRITVDGGKEIKLQPDKVKTIKRAPGKYFFKTTLNQVVENRFDQEFSPENNNSIIRLKSTINTNVDGKRKYQCFIAGSTTIYNERNAARAVLSILHNEYERFNCDISSYTFEDFSNKHNEYGQQDLYFDFIQNTADCVIFIICKSVGQTTKEEYLKAMLALKEHGSRPAIFVYNDATPEYDSTGHLLPPDDEVIEFKKTVQSQNCYWANYQDIDNLMNLIRIDIDQELKKALNLQPLTI